MFVATGCKINPSGGGGSSSPSTITHVFIGWKINFWEFDDL
jgi:hypothetical protein